MAQNQIEANGQRVIIVGGGIGGLSAAHELAERGFEVVVYELNNVVGGKARSQPLKGTGTAGRQDLPGEHGFRFYPRFYAHLIDTMERTPLVDRPGKNVTDNLIDTTQAAIACADGQENHRFWRRFPPDAFGIAEGMELWFDNLGADSLDISAFSLKILEYFTSSEERRSGEYEHISWWDFLDGDRYSDVFKRYLRAVPRTMVAMDPIKGCARTIGDISMQLIIDYSSSGVSNDRTLNGPTSEAWLEHWAAHLKTLGVRFELGQNVLGFEFDEGQKRITGVRVAGTDAPVRGDWYIAAVPVEIMQPFVTDALAAADPGLRSVQAWDIEHMTSWMVGIQYFLYEDVATVRGHVFYPDSPWALTSISQAQFWREHGMFRARYGDGRVGGVISVDISDWDTPGTFVKKTAKMCTPDEIKHEIWEQLKTALNDRNNPVLVDENLFTWHLDSDMFYPPDGSLPPHNRSPLLVHPPGHYIQRPEPATQIENLCIASDYARTWTNLASMEGANEAARRSVNAILDRAGMHDVARCELWPLTEPDEFARWRRLDARRFAQGKPHIFETMGIDRLLGGMSSLRELLEKIGFRRITRGLSPFRAVHSGERALRRLYLYDSPGRASQQA